MQAMSPLSAVGAAVALFASAAGLLAAQHVWGRRLFASLPREITRQRRVSERYAHLAAPWHTMLRPFARALLPWSGFVVLTVGVLVLAEVRIWLTLVVAGCVALYASVTWEKLLSLEERRFWSEVEPRPDPSPRATRLARTLLSASSFVAWILGSAMIGVALGLGL